MGQQHYGTRRRKAFDGMAHTAEGKTRSLINEDPKAAQIENLQVSTVTQGGTYGFDINSVPIEVTAPASGATATSIRDQLIAAVADEDLVNGSVLAELKDADEFTLTALLGGLGFTLTNITANLTRTTTQANATAARVPFGRVVIFDDLDKKTGKLAKASSMEAQVDTLGLTYDAGVDAIVHVEVDGERYTAEHTQATDAATSVAALAAQLNAQLPAETVIASADGDDLVLTAELAGKAFKSSTGFGTGRDTGAWAKASTASMQTDLNRAYAGCTRAVASVEVPPGETEASYPPGRPMSVRHDKAKLRLAVEEDVSTNTDVYVRLAANGSFDKLGGVRATPDTGCVKLEGARVERRLDSTFAVVEFP